MALNVTHRFKKAVIKRPTFKNQVSQSSSASFGVLKSYKPILSTVFLSFLKRERERDFANFSDRLYVHYDRS